jgi:predicted peroxiredoxin
MSFPKFRLAPLFLLLLATCTDSPTAPSPQPLTVSRNLVAGEEMKPRFLFLPPLGPPVRIDGAFDGSLQPVVEICQWNSGRCVGAIVARFTTAAGPNQIRVFGSHTGEDGNGNSHDGSDGNGNNNQYHGNEGHGGGDGHSSNNDHDASDRFYGVDWNTSHSTIVSGKIYRLRALLGATELGHVDVQFSTHWSGNDDDNWNAGASNSAGVITARKDRTLPIKFWIAKPLQRITVVLGRGVTGSPAALDSMFRFGSSIRYSYQAMEGFDNLQVSLDGAAAPSSGTVVANATHVLYVTVERTVTLTPELQPLYLMARGLLTAADPVTATQAYLNRAAEYVRTRDPDAALAQLRDVHYLAFDQLVDSAAVRRLDAALANHVFEIASASTASFGIAAGGSNSTSLATSGARFALSADAGDPDAIEQTKFLYINGIWNALSDVLATEFKLVLLTDEIARFRGNPHIQVTHFYNRTRSVQVPTTRLEAERNCVANYLSQVQANIKDANAAGVYMYLCMADAAYRRWTAADLVESARQSIEIAMTTPAPEADALMLATQIQTYREAGNQVILLPHSQGNLMAIQAIHQLREVTGEYNPQRDSTCIGAVSLASPLSNGWELPDHYLAHVVVSGDPVPDLILAGNTWNRITTDSSIAILLEVLGNGSYKRVLDLHSVNSSYLTAQARDSVKAGMNEVYDACAVDHIDVKPFSATLRPGETMLLVADLINKYADTLSGRQIDWTSSNGASASVSHFGTTKNGLIGGVAAGSALIVATNHAASSGVFVTVLQPPLEIFPSTYTSPVPTGFGGNTQCDDAGGIPTPATTFYLKFFEGRAVMLKDFDGSQHIIDQIYEELLFPSGVAIRGGDERFRLYWNADRTQLTGTVIHSRFNCPGGITFENSDAVTFTRSGS